MSKTCKCEPGVCCPACYPEGFNYQQTRAFEMRTSKATSNPDLREARQSLYGPWDQNMAATSEQIRGILRQWESCNPGKDVPLWFTPLVMVAVKLNRIASGRYHADNFADLRVYLDMVEQMQQGTV